MSFKLFLLKMLMVSGVYMSGSRLLHFFIVKENTVFKKVMCCAFFSAFFVIFNKVTK